MASCLRRPAASRTAAGALPRLWSGSAWAFIGIAALVLFVLVPVGNLAGARRQRVPRVRLLGDARGKIMCYAIVALAMDLIWGYTGILSLGHGLFFALGGYAMGMYLMRSIGRDGVYKSDLPDFMVFLDWKAYPWYWSFTDHFWYAALLVVLGAGHARLRVRLLRVPLADQGRLLLDHHAGADVRVHAAVLPQRHGLRRQQRLHRLQAHPRVPDRRAGDAHGAVHGHRRGVDRLRCCSAARS